jgi:Tfp pilus assembly protein PilN
MTRIDLIPPEVVEKHQSRRIITVLVLVFAALFGILLVVYLITLGQAMMASSRVDIIKGENTKVQKYTQKLQPYADRQKALDERQAIIEKMTADQVMWSSILNDISMVVPNDIWLRDVKMDLSDIIKAKEGGSAASKSAIPKPPITIVGYAFNHAAVARWLVHLNEINQFRGVWLDYATEQTLSSDSSSTAGTSQTAGSAATPQPVKVIEFQTTVYLTKFSDKSETKKTTP